MSTDLKVLEAKYVQRVEGLVGLARQGNLDAFGALVIKDQDGSPIELAPIHRSWSAFVPWCWQQGLYAGILAPWRHGKTTLCTIRLALWEIGKNPDVRVRIICADDDEAILRVSAIRRYLESPEYRWIFPHIEPGRLGDWSKHRLFVNRTSPGPDPTLEAAGVFTGEAGGGNDLIVLDDIVTYQNSILRPSLRNQVFDVMSAVWLRRVEPDTRIVAVGTTWHVDDAYQKLRKQGGRWRWLVQGVSDDFERIDCHVD
jgi:hypothetical protein